MITALVDLMAACYRAGNPTRMAAVAHSILASVPDDTVALHFLGLAYYQMGQHEAAREVFARIQDRTPLRRKSDYRTTTGEKAATRMLREASRPASGLGEAWQHVARAMRELGFRHDASRAYERSLATRSPRLQSGAVARPSHPRQPSMHPG
jgi:tetratricopeptide (TPR) repeat protein